MNFGIVFKSKLNACVISYMLKADVNLYFPSDKYFYEKQQKIVG
jgi:hypothetical protein